MLLDIITYLFIGLITIISFGMIFILLINKIIIKMRYKSGRNMFHRICKKCGAHQVVYESCFGSWWEEVYPIGNNPDCKCHGDAEYRNW